MSQPAGNPTPERIFATINAYHSSAVLKAAIDLDLFSAVARGVDTADALAVNLNASPRGIRIVSDYLTVLGFLTKTDGRYDLSQESRMFLVRTSPAYMGGSCAFLMHNEVMKSYSDLAETVRRGRTILEGEGTVSVENQVWEDFARGMMPMMFPSSQFMAGLLARTGPQKVLDIAAGHGLFGIAIAQANPQAQITAVDWPGVLNIAKENAEKMGVADRVKLLPGDAFDVDFGTGYDLVLVTNFLHHFDMATNENFLKKVRAALKPDGQVAVLEFCPNDDRVSPPAPATFALIMLANTKAGDAYTVNEYNQMFAAARLTPPHVHQVPGMPQTVLVARPA